MAKYKPQIRQDETTVVDLDLCAKYDGEGNDIVETYAKKAPAAITDFGAAYNAGYNFNGKTITFNTIDYVAGSSSYYHFRIDFANGYKIHGYAGGGMEVLVYNPYAGSDEILYNMSSGSTALPITYGFRDGTNDIGADCTITGFYASSSDTVTQITPSEFTNWITIEFDSVIEVDGVISVNGKKGKVVLKTSDLTNDSGYILPVDLKTINGESITGGGDITISGGIPVIDLGTVSTITSASGTLSNDNFATIENSEVVALKLQQSTGGGTTHWFYLTQKSSGGYTFSDPNGGRIGVLSTKYWQYAAPTKTSLYRHSIFASTAKSVGIFFTVYSSQSTAYTFQTLPTFKEMYVGGYVHTASNYYPIGTINGREVTYFTPTALTTVTISTLYSDVVDEVI